jgi:hypothetical protein
MSQQRSVDTFDWQGYLDVNPGLLQLYGEDPLALAYHYLTSSDWLGA